ncbi:DUF2189 domain-containing protein [Paracraurococcus lichenis]|uniref:DUF2189 domain-containing protein n=1 Tax=Paracraurococcus lichenis TaxID=3064888 RepID=A0ABT9E546_9PROT|nr:DUF2189 domain-containing protein [Paracraurococcus sp. LOR1-02]MDO9711294.1 DUF2189 domain-containing protein [Paracraurococcus sp. LOR1-02]
MTVETLPLAGRPTNRVRIVTTDRPWVWLTAGWQDMLASKPITLAYGGAVCLAGWVLSLLLFEVGTLWAILPATSGFFLIGPLVAAGLYEASRVRAEGRQPTLADAIAPFRRNGSQIAYVGVALLVIHLFWVRIAGLLFMLFFGLHGVPSLERLPYAMLQSDQLLPFLVIGTGFGFVLAAASFAVAAVSIPMLVDKEISALEAVTVSIQAVLENIRPMLLWAGLIVVFTGLALVPFYLGLVLVFPLIGHATWHAYKDMVVR